MTPFEYVLALVSIVVGLAVADLATSLHRMLRARHVVRWDWLALMAATLAALTVLQFWWSFYQVGQAQVWRVYGQFLPLLALLVVLVLLAAAALPDEVPATGLHLRDYYAGNARYFWTLFAVLLVLASVVSVLPAAAGAGTAVSPTAPAARRGRAPLELLILGQGANLVIAVIAGSLALVGRRAYHRVVVPLLLLVLGILWSRLRLDTLAG